VFHVDSPSCVRILGGDSYTGWRFVDIDSMSSRALLNGVPYASDGEIPYSKHLRNLLAGTVTKQGLFHFSDVFRNLHDAMYGPISDV
jgi:hypothetical protein